MNGKFDCNDARVRSSLLLFVIAVLVCASVSAAPKPAPATLPTRYVELRIAVIPYNGPPAGTDTDEETSLHAYFDAVAKQVALDGIALRTELVRGSYYQVLQWLRAGEVDGAIVSPFSAYLLTTDPQLTTVPLAEFVRGDDPPRGVPNTLRTPAIVETNRDGTSMKASRSLDDCLEAAIDSLDAPKLKQPCQLRLINHLSTTGFVMPLAHVKLFLEKREKQLTPDRQRKFWQRLLEWSTLEVWHPKPGTTPKSDRPIISFRYARGGEVPNLQVPEGFEHQGDVLLLAARRSHPIRIPPELLETSWTDDAPWKSAGKALAVGDVNRKRRYIDVRPWDANGRKRFAKAVDTLFDRIPEPKPAGKQAEPSILSSFFERWYQRGDYTFTIEELMKVLRTDQQIRARKRFVIVLPGGGVRATYQARILDYLYDASTISNHARGDAMLVNGVAGTSGGAIGGLLAASRTDRKSELADYWRSVKPSQIFPWFGLFRWMSVLLVLAVFSATASIHLPHLKVSPKLEPPFWYTTLLTVVIAASPLLIWHNSSLNPAYAPYVEGYASIATLLVAHFSHSVLLPRHKPPVKWLSAGIVLVAGGAVAAVLLATSSKVKDADLVDLIRSKDISILWTFFSASVLAGLVAGLTIAAWSVGNGVDRQLIKAYVRSLAVLGILVCGAALVFACGMWAGSVTTLEMTPSYWVWVLAGALIVSKIIVLVSRLYPHSWLDEGIAFLVSPSATKPFVFSPAISLTVWGAMAAAVWLIFIAPALYSNREAHTVFNAQATKKKIDVPLVVSLTCLGSEAANGLLRGDYYAINEDAAADTTSAEVSPTQMRQLPRGDFQSAIFASGSPFPVYPAVQLPWAGRDERFIDGGYAHRVPIEAARIAGATQILVVENAAWHDERLPSHTARLGPLTTDLGRTLSFLFDRSQGFDVQKERSALVATIAPDWTTADPFLMDFRPSVVSNLLDQANGDIERGHRIGHISSWGVPPDREER